MRSRRACPERSRRDPHTSRNHDSPGRESPPRPRFALSDRRRGHDFQLLSLPPAADFLSAPPNPLTPNGKIKLRDIPQNLPPQPKRQLQLFVSPEYLDRSISMSKFQQPSHPDNPN